MSDTNCCPACHQRVLIRHGVRLSPKLADIFDAIAASKERGIDVETLSWMFYPDKPKHVAARCVIQSRSRINDLLVETDYWVTDGGRRNQLPYRIERRLTDDTYYLAAWAALAENPDLRQWFLRELEVYRAHHGRDGTHDGYLEHAFKVMRANPEIHRRFADACNEWWGV